MKTLLILPLVIFLIACGTVEEESVKIPTVVEEAMEIFVINKEILEDELLFGALCLLEVKETGNKKSEVCNLYFYTQTTAIDISRLGIDIFVGLYDEGYLVEEAVYFEVVDIIERISDTEIIVKELRKMVAEEVDKTRSSKCVKCVI